VADCANCAAVLGGPYCSQCGQEDGPLRPSIHEFVREFGNEHFGLDSKIGHTLRALLVPGALTREYLAGRRARYVRPLRLYISISVIFFLILALRGRDAGVVKLNFGTTTPTATAAAPRVQSWFDQLMERKAAKLRAESLDEAAHGFSERFTHWLGDGMFLLVPVFAAIVGLLVRGDHTYGEHFVFALHVHAFAFLALIPPLLVPASWRSVTDLFAIGVLVYALVALRHVYKLTRRKTAFVGVGIGVVYGLLLSITMAGLALLTLLTA
jgi:hypothetical protein